MLSGYKELFKILLLMSSRISTFIQALHWNEEQLRSGERDGTEIVFPVHIQYTPTFPTV